PNPATATPGDRRPGGEAVSGGGGGAKLGDDLENGILGERLGQKAVHQRIPAGEVGDRRGLRGDHEDAALRLQLLETPGHLQAVEGGEVEIDYRHLVVGGVA